MTILETRTAESTDAFTGKWRRRAAWVLLPAPVLFSLSVIFTALAQRAAGSTDDAEVAVGAPTMVSLSSLADFLAVPAAIACFAAVLIATRPWSRKAAWTGAIAGTLQACALAAVVGMELLAAVLVQQGADAATVQAGSDAVANNAAGLAMLIFFIPGEIISFAFLGVALWRTHWVPRPIPVMVWLIPVADIATPGEHQELHLIGFTILLVAFAWLALAISRSGAPHPVAEGHTK